MFFQNLPRAVLFALMPRLSHIPVLFGVEFLTRYEGWYESTRRGAIEYHKNQLRRLDHQFRWNEANLELVRRREVAREKGIGPLDPGYPSLSDVLPD